MAGGGDGKKATFLALVALFLVSAAYEFESSSTTAAEAAAAAGGGNGTSEPSAYDMLERYDFPRGILPVGVQGYTLGADGAFEVYLPRACEFLLSRTWLVRYDARVSGSAASGRLAALRGVSVKVLFFWVAVAEVDRTGDQLSFYVGPVATSFPLADFADSPRCRGYDEHEHDGSEAAASS